ncbi:hypothetical protein ACJMK2_011334 [Sinanodonta woodiana]|uniref:Uncharacterized protein n=1 Tax=Sinanodonta woodiana TaxID=1069815 RepID=A0ABD3V4N1_SINWO
MNICRNISLKCCITYFVAVWIFISFLATCYVYEFKLYNYIWQQPQDGCISCEHHENKNQVAFENLELYLRMTSKFTKQYYDFLLPSLRYFWPGNASLVIVLDEENPQDKELGLKLSQTYPYPRVEYQSPIDPGIYHRKGHERMQRDFFYPEGKIKTKYVGFLDTDTVFVTRVIPDLLFEEGKPIIFGFYGKSSEPYYKRESFATASMYKSKEVVRGMSYFPVIMEVSHIVELRKYLEKLHNKSFDEIYRQHSGGPISQFSIMTQYMWSFHRDKYKFHFHLRSYNNGTWHGEANSPNRHSYEFYQNNVTDDQRSPKPRSSIHYRYYPNWRKPITLRNAIKTGICFSGGFDLCPDQCKHLNQSSLHTDLYFFEFIDWSWDKRSLDEQKKHYAKVLEQRNAETDNALKVGCVEANKLWFKP